MNEHGDTDVRSTDSYSAKFGAGPHSMSTATPEVVAAHRNLIKILAQRIADGWITAKSVPSQDRSEKPTDFAGIPAPKPPAIGPN